jgi:hypothetical protein
MERAEDQTFLEVAGGQGLPDPQTRLSVSLVRRMEQRRFRRARQRRSCRPHLQGQCSACRLALDVDLSFRESRGSNANARLCREPRSREEMLAANRRAPRCLFRSDPKRLFGAAYCWAAGCRSDQHQFYTSSQSTHCPPNRVEQSYRGEEHK